MASYKREFSPLAGKPGADILDVSCTQSWHEQVEIGFPFSYGNSTISSVIVDTNGQLKLDLNDTQTNYCTAVPLGGHGKPRFAFANGNLAPITFGDVTVCRTTNSFVISFEEEVESFSETNMAAGGRINASIKLFRNGSIQVCYGSLTMAVKPSDNCAGGLLIAGIEDGSIKIPIANVTDGDGAFLGDAFPAPGCYQKEPANDFFAPIV